VPFTKGQSGNKQGRPKKGETLTDLLREKFEATKSAKGKLPRKEILIEKLLTLAESGDLPALKYIFDRCDGRPMQTLEINNDAVDRRLMEILNDNRETN